MARVVDFIDENYETYKIMLYNNIIPYVIKHYYLLYKEFINIDSNFQYLGSRYKYLADKHKTSTKTIQRAIKLMESDIKTIINEK